MVIGRPVKTRRVACTPEFTYFKPAGVPLIYLDEVCLTVEEAEAIRLKDLEDLEQEEAAKRMNISRPTFHRILNSSRQKLADALLNGKSIRIDGGNFMMATSHFTCGGGHKWEVPFEKMIDGAPVACPKCNSRNIKFTDNIEGTRRKGQGRRRRRGMNW
jgi:predicted DNA-binding protein (UPF0251 family)